MGLQSVQKYIKELAFAEGLPNHYYAVEEGSEIDRLVNERNEENFYD